MAKPEWGTKRACQSCGSKFYDFGRTPIVCPNCGAVFDLEVMTRARRPRSAPRAAVVADEEESAPEVAAGEDDADVEEAAGDEGATDEDAESGDEDESLIEDASELSDDDEVEDVIEGEIDDDDQR